MDKLQIIKKQYDKKCKQYELAQKNCDARIQVLAKEMSEYKRQIEAIKEEKRQISYPYAIESLIVPILKELNKSVKVRGYQFETKELQGLGLCNTINVFQDYEQSKRSTPAYFQFRVRNERLMLIKETGTYKNPDSIRALNDMDAVCIEVKSMDDLLAHIEEAENRQRTNYKSYIAEYGSLENLVQAVREGKCHISCLPEELWTEDIIADCVSRGREQLEYIPKDMRSYKVCIAAVQSSEFRFSNHLLSYIPIKVIDKNLFKTALLNCVPIYKILNQKQLIELDAFEPNFVKEILSVYPHYLKDIPSEYMKDEFVLITLDKQSQVLEESALGNISATTAEIIFKRLGARALEYIPEHLITLEMCHTLKNSVNNRAFKYYLNSVIPERHKNKAGHLKRLPKL